MAKTDEGFFERAGLDRSNVQSLVDESLRDSDDGELFLEYRQSESFVFDDGRLKAATFDTTQGFGLRAVAGEATGYAHASELSEAAIEKIGASGSELIATIRFESFIPTRCCRAPEIPTAM